MYSRHIKGPRVQAGRG